ncbi:MAG: hypothetical protein E7598_00460 [Ruminococcaceae bacterium]|nr:hypothetical protein [Oscillospiraceae bacterium]
MFTWDDAKKTGKRIVKNNKLPHSIVFEYKYCHARAQTMNDMMPYKKVVLSIGKTGDDYLARTIVDNDLVIEIYIYAVVEDVLYYNVHPLSCGELGCGKTKSLPGYSFTYDVSLESNLIFY